MGLAVGVHVGVLVGVNVAVEVQIGAIVGVSGAAGLGVPVGTGVSAVAQLGNQRTLSAVIRRVPLQSTDLYLIIADSPLGRDHGIK